MFPSERILQLFVSGLLIFIFHTNAIAERIETTLYSNTLQESRQLKINTPANFSRSKSYPVIYVLDGDGHFDHVVNVTNFLSGTNRIPPVIVVGIKNVDRVRDFTPIHSLVRLDGVTDSARLATSGGGKKFLLFLQKELIPFIDKSYPTQPFRILSGHSLGGLFAFHAFETSPELFQAFIIISPAFFGGNKSVLTSLPEIFREKKYNNTKIYLTIGNEPRLQQGMDTLVNYFKNAPKQIAWKYKTYEDEDHASVPYISWYDGLKFIYADWYVNLSDSAHYSSYHDIKNHFSTLSAKFGYTILPTEEIVNAFGFEQLYFFKDAQGAIITFQENIKNNPGSANAYGSLAEAYAAQNQKSKAIENYQKALSLDPKNKKFIRKLEILNAIK